MSGENRLTVYELLTELWRLEKSSPNLCKLPEDLEDRLREYISKTRSYLKVSDKRSLTASLREEELEAVRRLAGELFEMRMRKIIRAALKGESLENLYGFERRFYAETHREIEEHKEKIRELTSITLYRSWKPIPSRYVVVCFQRDFPQIVGQDLKTYGPFKRGDIVSLPGENAQTLLLRGVVKKLTVSSPEVKID